MFNFYKDVRTVGDVLSSNRGVGPGFNALRLMLSITILWMHCPEVTGEPVHVWSGWHALIRIPLVPVFFALSGFLVTGSALRTNSIKSFIALRLLRIVPALLTEVTLSALILGPLFTTVPLSDYFSDRQFWSYFGNIIGHISYKLPGVFESNPISVVNQNLWTLKPEFYCYIIMVVMIMMSVLRMRVVFLCFLVILSAASTFVMFFYPQLLPFTTHLHWTVIVFCFLNGCAFYQWRERIRLHWTILLACVVATLLIMITDIRLAFFLAPFVTYCVVYAGMAPIILPKRIASYDVSYGIYLYGYPIQQTVVALVKSVHENGLLLFLIATPLTGAIALLSWVWIEKPFLRLKPYVTGKARKTLVTLPTAVP